MWRYFELLSFRSLEDVAKLKAAVESGANPRDIKMALADELIGRFHGKAEAQSARESFIGRHRHGEIPEDLEEQVVVAAEPSIGLAQLLREAGLVASASEAIRMVRQGAVRIDGERVSDHSISVPAGGESAVYQVGKRRFARVRVESTKK